MTTDRDFHASVTEIPRGFHPDLAAAFRRAHEERRTRLHPTLADAFEKTGNVGPPPEQVVDEFPHIAPWAVVSVRWADLVACSPNSLPPRRDALLIEILLADRPALAWLVLGDGPEAWFTAAFIKEQGADEAGDTSCPRCGGTERASTACGCQE